MKEKDRVYWLGVTATFFAITITTILVLSSLVGLFCFVLFFSTLVVLSIRKVSKLKETIKRQEKIIDELEKINSELLKRVKKK